MTQLSISQARNRLTRLAGELNASRESVEVTSRGKPVLAILPWELYESMVETMDILSDEELMGQVREGIREYKEGKGVPLDEAKRRLGL